MIRNKFLKRYVTYFFQLKVYTGIHKTYTDVAKLGLSEAIFNIFPLYNVCTA